MRQLRYRWWNRTAHTNAQQHVSTLVALGVCIRQFTLSVLVCLTAACATDAPAELPGWLDWQGSNLLGTGAEPLPYKPVPILTAHDWQNLVGLIPIPGPRGQYLALERRGNIWLVNADGRRTPFLTLTGNLLTACFDPQFPKTPTFYLRYMSQGVNRLCRFQVIGDDAMHADLNSKETILEWPTIGHEGGGLLFGADGFLYVTTGDASKPGDPDNLGQKTDDLTGSVLRLDVGPQATGKSYGIPKDNPFIGVAGVRPELWAYGLRNPWQATFRPGTNELWIGDNGDESWEMIHRTTRGTNHGWSAFEGNHIFRPSSQLEGPVLKHTPPVVEHSHQEMRSVIGGRWYRGSKFPELRDHYIYGGHLTGKLWAFSMTDGRVSTPKRIADIGAMIVSFAEDPAGELIIVTYDRGLFHLEVAPERPVRPIPTLLSQTGLFADVSAHKSAPGALPYHVNLPYYRDGSVTERFLAMPKDQKIIIRYSHKKMDLLPPLRTRATLDRFEMPEGTTIVKTFAMPAADGQQRRIETQISINDGGEWRFLGYRWNETQTDATLVPEFGDQSEILFADGQKRLWRFPGRAECAACHTHLSRFVPGMNLAQLNRQMDYSGLGGKTMNQLDVFRKVGFLPNNFSLPDKKLVMPAPTATDTTLEDRARSYLHVNCAHCHRQAGLGGRAAFQMLSWLKNENLDLFNRLPLVGLPGGSPKDDRLLVPGHPEHSDIYRRMAIDGPGRMPLFGATTVDHEGAALIAEWIKSLKQ